MNLEKEKSLAPFTSWLVGGAAETYVAPENMEVLKEAMVWARNQHVPVSILGGGTNVLVSDEGVKGLVIHTHKLNQVQVVSEQDELVVETQCGVQKSEVLKVFLKYRLAPAIFLAGLPGDMAGGVVMNAGVGHSVKPSEFCEIVKNFQVLTFNESGRVEERTFDGKDIAWSYRKSKNWQPGVISKIQVAWPMDPSDQVLSDVREGNKRRKSTQPLSQPSCGSVFKNPEGDHSGRLIESCGLKGFAIGGAQVSEKHANFIVNTGSATASEINQVIRHVQNQVMKKKKIHLTNEVVYLGQW